MSVLGIDIRLSHLFSRGESYIFFSSVLGGPLSVFCSWWQTEHLRHSTVGLGDYSLASSSALCKCRLGDRLVSAASGLRDLCGFSLSTCSLLLISLTSGLYLRSRLSPSTIVDASTHVRCIVLYSTTVSGLVLRYSLHDHLWPCHEFGEVLRRPLCVLFSPTGSVLFLRLFGHLRLRSTFTLRPSIGPAFFSVSALQRACSLRRSVVCPWLIPVWGAQQVF